MNSKHLIAAMLAIAPLASAFADDYYPGADRAMDVNGTKTRAQVNQELKAYKAAGVFPWKNEFNPLKYFRSERTREEVVAEFLADREGAQALASEDGGAMAVARGHAPVAATTRLAQQH